MYFKNETKLFIKIFLNIYNPAELVVLVSVLVSCLLDTIFVSLNRTQELLRKLMLVCYIKVFVHRQQNQWQQQQQ